MTTEWAEAEEAQHPVEMPDATYAVLSIDGRLEFKSVPSRATRKGVTLYHNGPWDAALEEIGGPCRSLDRSLIGSGMMAWVAGEGLLQPDDYPENAIGGRTLNILREFEAMPWQGHEAPEELTWAGTIVITTSEDLSHNEWCGAIWPLDEEQRWLITEAYRAARGDSGSMLFPDEDEDGWDGAPMDEWGSANEPGEAPTDGPSRWFLAMVDEGRQPHGPHPPMTDDERDILRGITRHILAPGDGTYWEVGWDPPLNTFFAQLWPGPPGGDQEPSEPLAWHGTDWAEIPTVEALARRVAMPVAPEVVEALRAERERRPAPSWAVGAVRPWARSVEVALDHLPESRSGALPVRTPAADGPYVWSTEHLVRMAEPRGDQLEVVRPAAAGERM